MLSLPYAVFVLRVIYPVFYEIICTFRYFSFGSAEPSSGSGMTFGGTLEELTGLFEGLCGLYLYRTLQYNIRFPRGLS